MRIIGAVFFFAFGVWCAWCAFAALGSGTAYAAGGLKYPRKKRPVMYWFAVSAQTFLAIYAFTLVYRMLR